MCTYYAHGAFQSADASHHALSIFCIRLGPWRETLATQSASCLDSQDLGPQHILCLYRTLYVETMYLASGSRKEV
jgi:hypothetical protein